MPWDKDVSLSGSADIGPPHPASMSEGMPSPAWLRLVADNTPPCINVCGCHVVDADANVLWMQVIQDRRIDILAVRGLFGHVSMTVV